MEAQDVFELWSQENLVLFVHSFIQQILKSAWCGQRVRDTAVNMMRSYPQGLHSIVVWVHSVSSCSLGQATDSFWTPVPPSDT